MRAIVTDSAYTYIDRYGELETCVQSEIEQAQQRKRDAPAHVLLLYGYCPRAFNLESVEEAG